MVSWVELKYLPRSRQDLFPLVCFQPNSPNAEMFSCFSSYPTEGSQSPYLRKGLNLMTEMSRKYRDSLLGARMAATVANSFTKSFFSIGDRPEIRRLKRS